MKDSTSDFVTVDDLKIRYWSNSKLDKASEGKPSVVFFHGYSFSLDNWLEIGTLDLLSKKGFQVFAIDLPSGKASKSDKMRKDDKMAAAPLIKKILDSIRVDLNGKSQIVMIGPSMGGGFALAYAITYPESVAGLVLISPSLKSIDEVSISDLKMPVLLIWGDKDNVFPVNEFGQNLKKSLMRSKLIILKGAGHAAYLDKPEEFHEILADFLEEISP